MALIKPADTQIILPIDKIARMENRDVLFLEFLTVDQSMTYQDFANFEHRKEIMQWLDDNGFDYQECSPFTSSGLWANGYLGHLYIKDVPFDASDSRYKQLEEKFENSDGEPAIKGVVFYYLPLDMALENASQDSIPNKMKRRR